MDEVTARFRDLGKRPRILRNRRPGVVVHRHGMARLEKVERVNGILRPHRKIVSDRQQRRIESAAPDELHVHEQRRVARMIKALPIRLDDETAGHSHVDRVEPGIEAGCMVGNRELDAPKGETMRAAGIHAVRFGAAGGKVFGDFKVGDDRGVVGLGNFQRITRMILVPVRYEDIITLHVGGSKRSVGVASQEGVDHEAGAGGFDKKTGVSVISDAHEPGDYEQTRLEPVRNRPGLISSLCD